MSGKPFLLKPAGKDYLWGGNRLNEEFGKGIPMKPLAETWECSTHPDGPSTVAGGEFDGMTLRNVLKAHPEFIGSKFADPESADPQSAGSKFAVLQSQSADLKSADLQSVASNAGSEGELPILIKLIDAKQNLSVQVHPDDDYARKNENGSLGKTEMWYVLDADEDAYLIHGFCRDMNRETLRRSLQDGSVENYLRKIRIQKGDVFFIEPGTIHAIGAGALIAEIQESSNITYRLYDYNRRDKNGNLRELHIEKSLEMVNFRKNPPTRQQLREQISVPGCDTELLCRCEYFLVERMQINTELSQAPIDLPANSDSFRVLLCTDGSGKIKDGDGESLNFVRGDCIFVPAGSVGLKIDGKAELLWVK